jgi:hypothetical protein
MIGSDSHHLRRRTLAVAAAALLATLAPGVPSAGAKPKTKETRLVASLDGWASSASNRGVGGGSRFGCRAPAGAAASCLRSRNMGGGLAFVFATGGRLGGLIEVGSGGDEVRPFTTNATGVATGLNADRVDGREASDFLPTGGKAADADKLDGLDATQFARAGAPAGDADTVDGMHASEFLAASRLLSLGGDPRIEAGDPVSTIAAGGGLTFKASCAAPGGVLTITVLMSVASGSARFGFAEPATVGSDQVDVSTADGDVEVLEADENTIGSDTVTPVQVAVVRDDGTTLSGTLSVAVGFGPSDCFVSGALMG